MKSDRVFHVNYGDDILRILVDLILDSAVKRPVDLSRHVVLLSQPSAALRLRRLLLDSSLERDIPALIPPVVESLHSWINRYNTRRERILTDAERELLLLEATREFPTLSATANAWTFVHNALTLFDELNFNAVTLTDDLAQLTQRLARAYGINDASLRPLNNEARLVHRLWHGWRDRLKDINSIDASEAIVSSLNASHADYDGIEMIYLVGHVSLSNAEFAWMARMLTAGKLTVLTQAGLTIDDNIRATLPGKRAVRKTDYSLVIDHVYSGPEVGISARIAAAIEQSPNSPIRGRLHIYTAEHPEDEASAIDLQIRRWLLDGKKDIGLVTNDRRLARRIRALLERSNVSLDDATGWPMSTTSAASVLDRILEAIERNFTHDILLDILRSPFVRLGGRKDLATAAARLEIDVIQRLSIHSGLDDFQRALRRGRKFFDDRYGLGETEVIIDLLADLAAAALPLEKLARVKSASTSTFVDALISCLEATGVAENFREDTAGIQLLEILESMQAAANAHSSVLDWLGFRTWIRGVLERSEFHNVEQFSGIELRAFSNCRLSRFDALVIAGATRDQLPGNDAGTAFFNDAVRKDLGMTTSIDRRKELFHDFRRLLEAAPEILITHSREDHEGPVQPSPWVERLRLFHRLAYGSDLEAVELKALRTVIGPVVNHHTFDNTTPSGHPRAGLSGHLPAVLTASAYQSLINCPYQYFARHCIGLSSFDEISFDMDKSEYGKRIHRILHAFHCGSMGNPAGELLSPTASAESGLRINEITAAIFDPEVRRNFAARAWEHRWRQNIEEYLAWQEKRSQKWKVHACELDLKRGLDGFPGITLHGKLDRIDSNNGNVSIIDYKTGSLPDTDEIVSGESVQLVFYGLLLKSQQHSASNARKLINVFFLKIDGGKVRDDVGISDGTLDTLLDNESRRMLSIAEMLRSGTTLAAWGASSTCNHCEMSGLCRKSYWTDDPIASYYA